MKTGTYVATTLAIALMENTYIRRTMDSKTTRSGRKIIAKKCKSKNIHLNTETSLLLVTKRGGMILSTRHWCPFRSVLAPNTGSRQHLLCPFIWFLTKKDIKFFFPNMDVGHCLAQHIPVTLKSLSTSWAYNFTCFKCKDACLVNLHRSYFDLPSHIEIEQSLQSTTTC